MCLRQPQVARQHLSMMSSRRLNRRQEWEQHKSSTPARLEKPEYTSASTRTVAVLATDMRCRETDNDRDEAGSGNRGHIYQESTSESDSTLCTCHLRWSPSCSAAVSGSKVGWSLVAFCSEGTPHLTPTSKAEWRRAGPEWQRACCMDGQKSPRATCPHQRYFQQQRQISLHRQLERTSPRLHPSGACQYPSISWISFRQSLPL